MNNHENNIRIATRVESISSKCSITTTWGWAFLVAVIGTGYAIATQNTVIAAVCAFVMVLSFAAFIVRVYNPQNQQRPGDSFRRDCFKKPKLIQGPRIRQFKLKGDLQTCVAKVLARRHHPKNAQSMLKSLWRREQSLQHTQRTVHHTPNTAAADEENQGEQQCQPAPGQQQRQQHSAHPQPRQHHYFLMPVRCAVTTKLQCLPKFLPRQQKQHAVSAMTKLQSPTEYNTACSLEEARDRLACFPKKGGMPSSPPTCNTNAEFCPVCLWEYKQGDMLGALSCQHCFHLKCIKRWFKEHQRCPICRFDRDEDN
mmetsp:Transcript_2982/g.5098  ORF Transcript_2982/g.5098 Transcript_2982/m.5098 type:complete len:312 (-) Transcript_2982:279-1214(-)